jgi:hypothetical protein
MTYRQEAENAIINRWWGVADKVTGKSREPRVYHIIRELVENCYAYEEETGRKMMDQPDSQLEILFRSKWEDREVDLRTDPVGEIPAPRAHIQLDLSVPVQVTHTVSLRGVVQPPPDPEQHPLIKEASRERWERVNILEMRQKLLDSIDLWWVAPYKDNLIAASFREDTTYVNCLQVYAGDLSVWFDLPFWFVTREEAQKDRLVKDILSRMREKLMRMIDGRDACEDAAGEP